jgi:hypothetical protein
MQPRNASRSMTSSKTKRQWGNFASASGRISLAMTASGPYNSLNLCVNSVPSCPAAPVTNTFSIWIYFDLRDSNPQFQNFYTIGCHFSLKIVNSSVRTSQNERLHV